MKVAVVSAAALPSTTQRARHARERRRADPDFAQRQRTAVQRYYRARRLKVFDLLGGRRCVRCGCTVVRLLEVNHKNGGGTREIQALGGGEWIRAILNGKRGTSDLEVVCKVCNVVHYVERRFPELKDQFTVVWRGAR